MELKGVRITKHETCKTYALKRIGFDSMIDVMSNNPTILDLVKDSRFNEVEKASFGCLLIWKEKQSFEEYSQLEITKKGVIVESIFTLNAHVGVFEKNGFVSDVCICPFTRFPKVRLRSIKELRKPDFILKY